jgi:hypothetical protein
MKRATWLLMIALAILVVAASVGCSTTPPDMSHPERIRMQEYRKCMAAVNATQGTTLGTHTYCDNWRGWKS